MPVSRAVSNPSLCELVVSQTRQRMPQADEQGTLMLKAVGWIILIIFIIGLLVVLGVFKAIF